MPVLEVPVFSAAAAQTAVAHGATRLEINRAGSYAAGGLTPTRAEVAAVVATLGPRSTVPLRVMIRPRGAPETPDTSVNTSVETSVGKEDDGPSSPDFVYSDAEFEQMRRDLAALAASGLLSAARGDGFVFGVLGGPDIVGRGPGGPLAIDERRNCQLVQAAAPYACVFHRAFDLVVAPAAGGRPIETSLAHLGRLRELGFAGVLTAGGVGGGAADHTDVLAQLAVSASVPASAPASASASPPASESPPPSSSAPSSTSRRPPIEIIMGGGMRSQNVGQLAATVWRHAAPAAAQPALPVSFHSSCLADAATAMVQGAVGEAVDGEEVARICTVLASLDPERAERSSHY